ncbi:light-harvesting protein [Cognatiyoonia sp. IB215182]|uniref:light-harvesting protein n=1 Tax=Cognatiyoonia sp. IB215182 TaxID=3097353 RepID=UPI002A0C40A5|nr:light-harvesting protein [Cognatiyoonia sp. IB215182]MDX8353548.1 light-harvesting protein [Cognatiyoonia sp. IB215182]
MNNAKMWLVVPPAVGVPVFLGAVAVGSFAVHVAVVSNTSWVADFLSGQPLGTGDMQASATTLLPDVDTAKAAYVIEGEDGSHEVTIIMPDGTVARAILQPNDVLASATTEAPPLIVEH